MLIQEAKEISQEQTHTFQDIFRKLSNISAKNNVLL